MRKCKYKTWTQLSPADQRWFRKNVSVMAVSNIAEHFSVPRYMVKQYRRDSGSAARRTKMKEREYVIANPLSLTRRDMSLVTGLSGLQIKGILVEQYRSFPYEWRSEAEEFLVDYYAEMTDRHLATCLGCTPYEIRAKAEVMSLARPFSWTTKQNRIVLKMAGKASFAQIAARLNVSEQLVRNRFTEKRLYNGLET